MPNWCSNTLTVSGPAADIARFKKAAKTTLTMKDHKGVERKRKKDFSFEAFMPCPPELDMSIGSTVIGGKKFSAWRNVDGKDVGVTDKEIEELKKKYGATNWYDWNCENLGTKWDVDGYLGSASKTELGYTFDSAWSPPVAGVVNLSKLFPTLSFELEYDEPGCDFWGICTVQNGEVLSDEQGPSKINEEFAEEEAAEEAAAAEASEDDTARLDRKGRK